MSINVTISVAEFVAGLSLVLNVFLLIAGLVSVKNGFDKMGQKIEYGPMFAAMFPIALSIAVSYMFRAGAR